MAGRPARSDSELTIIHHGATLQDLAHIFEMSVVEVKRRVVGRVRDVAEPGRMPRYKVVEAAPLLVTAKFDMEEVIKSLNPSKLPNALQDTFWKAQRNRQAFEEDKGDLWRTPIVIDVLSEVFKNIRLTVLMFSENVEQQVELTTRQREIITQLTDGMLLSAHANLVEKFKDYKSNPYEHGTPLTESDAIQAMLDNEAGENKKEFDDGFGD